MQAHSDQTAKIADYENKIRSNVELKSQKEIQKIDLIKKQEEKKTEKANLVRDNEESVSLIERLRKDLTHLENNQKHEEDKLDDLKKQLMLKTAHKKQQEKDRYKSDQEVQRNLNEIKDDEEHRKKIAGEVADAIAEMERISKEKVKREN